MNSLKSAALAAATLSLCLSSAHAQDILKKLNITYGGYLDGYYQYGFGRPDNGNTLNGRGIDIANSRPTLAFAEFDMNRATTAKSPFGFTLNLYAGKGPDLIHFTEPGGRNKYKNIRQAYVTYASQGKNPVTIDFGKFDTWIGYEGIDNRSQDEYSRSFNWTFSEPTYETGVRVASKLSDKLNGTLFVVQGWNEVEDGNKSKSFGASLSYAPDANTTFTLQNHYGVEGSNTANDAGSFGGIGFANPGTARVHLIDFIATRQITPKTKVAFNVDYASSVGPTNEGNWNGEALYVRHQITSNQGLGIRLERVEDTDGLRSGSPIMFHSMTGTYDYSFNKNATLRFELRYDFANSAFFASDSGPSKGRATATLAAIFRF